jgi:Fungal trichothecene efflux pump (TRI12)
LPAIAEIVPNKHRGTAQAVLDLVGLPWTVFGALIGNSMVKFYALSFKVNFIIGILLNVLTMIMILFFYKPPRGTLPYGKSPFKAFLELDWAGIALLACGIVPTLVGISSGGTLFPWKSAGVIAPMVIGFLSFAALFFWEWKGSRNPFFSPELFEGKNNRFGFCLILTFVAGMSLYAAAAFWTQQCQAMYFSDPTKIGLSSIPSGIGGVIGGFLGAMLIGRGRFFKAQYVLFYGSCLKMVADGLFTTLDPTKLILGMGAGFLGMFGVGAVMLAVIVTVQLTCSDKHIGLATLVLASVRSLGGSVSVSIYSSIMNNTLKKDAPVRIAAAAPDLPPAALKSLVPVLIGGRPQEALNIPGVTPENLKLAMEAIKWSWGGAFQ